MIEGLGVDDYSSLPMLFVVLIDRGNNMPLDVLIAVNVATLRNRV